ncbi:NADPH oxidase activator 1 [Clupea harengus]|uniref:NADPH oxidase activator 1 n=1 Tax=Clupea harengus TaxID=7950 RepID=A0A6P8FTP3_CLUHA|nr:NADPH oxidase activator 1 [Clupea harengus]
MLYTELLRLWDEAVKAVDGRDWQGALSKLEGIYEPTARTLFVTAAAHLALGQIQPAIQALDQTIAKDERLAVGFYQRSGVLLLADRLEEALADCIWAQKHMRDNAVIDYRQLGLRFKLFSWQVLYNAAAVHVRMGHWDKARDILSAAAEEKGGAARGGAVDVAMDSISRREVLAPLLVPEGEVFRPRKEEVEQLKQRDFLGKAKVITSVIPNDDYAGFDPLRDQKPGYYEPKVEGGQDSRYMRLKSAYVARTPEEVSVPAGAMVFMFSEADRNGMATVIHDGQKGLLPITMLDPVDPNKAKKKKKRNSVPSGIPLPPSLKPPTRPRTPSIPTEAPPSYVSSTGLSPPPQYVTPTSSPSDLDLASPSSDDPGTVVVKVHYRYTVALRVPSGTPYGELQQKIGRKLGQPSSQLRLRFKHHGSQALTPLETTEGLQSLAEVAEAGRATLWCQVEHPLGNRTILYQMVALYDYTAQGPEDLEFSEGDTIDILSEVNEEWLEGHTAGNIGIFPRCFAYQDAGEAEEVHQATIL